MEFLQSEIFRIFFVGATIGLTAAMLGVFVILRKLSYFPDALAHAALAGIALGLLAGINVVLGAAAFAIVMALGIASLERKKILGLDTIIVIFFSTALALAVVIAEFLQVSEDDLMGYLFGDISKITGQTFFISLAVAILVIFILFFKFKTWTKISFHEDLSAIEGINVKRENYLFMLLLALFVAVFLRVVGTILIGPLLVIPAAAANNVSRGFKGVFILAIIFSLFSTLLGIAASGFFHISAGPLIVLISAAVFLFSLFGRR